MNAQGDVAVRVAVISNHPMLMQPLTRWLSRECRIESAFVDIRSSRCVAQCRRHGSNVIVVDHASANGSLVPFVDELRRGMPDAKVLLMAARTDAHAMRLAADAGCAGLVATDQPPESLFSAVMAATGAPVPEVDELAVLKPLTTREQVVLSLLADGLGTAELAVELGVTRNTARAHVQHVIEKLGAHSKLEAVAIARRYGLL